MTTKNRLTELKIEEISLVDSPANKEARSVLFKRDGPEPAQLEKAVSEDDAAYSCPDCKESFTNIVSAKAHMGSKHPSSDKPPRKIQKDGSEEVDKLSKLERMMLAISKTLGLKGQEETVEKDTLLFIDDDDDIVSDLRQLLGIDPPEEGEDDPLAGINPGTPIYQVADALSVLGKIEKAGKKISADRMNRLKEAHGKLGQVIGEVDSADAPDAADTAGPKKPGGTGEAKTSTKKGKEGNMPTIEELQKQVTDLQAENEELKKSDSDAPSEAEEDIFKGLTPAATEKLRGEIAKNEAMEKRIAKMEDEQENVEFTKQATDLGLPNDFGPVLKRFSKNQSTPEDMEQLSGVFKAYNEAGHLAEVMREVGKAGPQGGTSAWDAIVAKGDEIRKAEPMLTAEQARSRAIEMEPTLKAEYDAERTGVAAA